MKLAVRVAVVVSVALLPVIGIEIYNTVRLYQARQVEIQQTAVHQALLAASELSKIMEGFKGVMLTVGQAQPARSFDTLACNEFVSQLTRKITYLSSIAVADENGQIRCASSPEQLDHSVANEITFKTSMLQSELIVGQYRVDDVTKKAGVPLALPMFDDAGKHIGVVISSLDPDWLAQQLAKRGISEGGSVTVADKSGVIIARQPEHNKFKGTKIPDAYRYLVTAAQPGFLSIKSQDGTERLLGYVPISSQPYDLYVSTGISIERSYLWLKSATWRQFIFTGIAMLLTMFLIYYLIRLFVTAPLEKLFSTVKAWQNNQLSARTGLSPTGGETGMLGFEFDRTIDLLAKREESINILMRELVHRSKNQMALLISLANRLARGQKTVDGYRDALIERLMALSTSQDLLVRNDGQPLDLMVLVQSQIKSFDTAAHRRIVIAGPALTVSPENARSIGMAIHELGTNAAKYGALAGSRGHVSISWKILQVKNNLIELSWVESGGPSVKHPDSSGFGRTLLEKIVPLQLNGTADINYFSHGFSWTVKFIDVCNEAKSA